MGLFEKRSLQPTFTEPPIPPFPGANVYGVSTSAQSVTNRPDTALTDPTVWACVSLLAGTVSSLTLELFRRTNDVPAKLPATPFITSPAPRVPQSQWLHGVMVSALTRGNAVGRISGRDSMLRPTQIDLLNPDKLDVADDPTKPTLTFKIKSTQEVIPAQDVWHMPGMTLPGERWGLSPISYAAATIGLDLSARRFASGFYDDGGIPKAILKTTQSLNKEQADTMKDRLKASFRGREPMVLGAGLDYQMISVNPDESQFLATQTFGISQIARFFGIPAEMVGGSSGSSLTYANVEQRSLDFLTYSLAPWLKRIEDSLSMLLPQPQFVKFRVEDLLRTDSHTRALVELLLIAAKVITPTEVRDDYGRPPMTEDQKKEADLVPLSVGPTGRPEPVGTPVAPGPPTVTPPDDQLGGSNG